MGDLFSYDDDTQHQLFATYYSTTRHTFCRIALHLFHLALGQFFHALYGVFVADDGFVIHFDNDDVFEADGVDVA